MSPVDRDAYRYLDAAGLARPVVIVGKLPAGWDLDTAVYLRVLDRSRRDLSRRLRVADLEQAVLAVPSQDFQVEVSAFSIGGGVTYVSAGKRLIYSEVCIGHVSRLLLDGECALRILDDLNSGKHVGVTHLQQRSRTIQNISSQTSQNAQAPRFYRRLELWANAVHSEVRLKRRKLFQSLSGEFLLEWIVGFGGKVQFVDAKPLPDFNLQFRNIFGGPTNLTSSIGGRSRLWIAPYGVRYRSLLKQTPVPYVLDTTKAAILSHFVTRTREVPRMLKQHSKQLPIKN